MSSYAAHAYIYSGCRCLHMTPAAYVRACGWTERVSHYEREVYLRSGVLVERNSIDANNTKPV